MGETAKVVISQEDANSSSITANGDLMIELETALGGILHIQEDFDEEGVQNRVSTLGTLDGDDVCPVLNIQQESDCRTKTHGNLTKFATFPSSGKTLSYVLNGRDEVPGAALHGQSSQIYENPCARSISMPNPKKLVSAMKGGREQQQATPWLVKMNVSWAPDVYDPPANSLSHTVKSHHHRHKTTKKKYQKHKYKGKSSPRGSCSERKHHHVNNRRSTGSNTTDFMQLRPQEFGNRSLQLDVLDESITEDGLSISSNNRLLPLDGYGQESEVMMPSMEVAELSVAGGHDSKCGSSFRASLAKVHVSIAEAT